MRSHGRSDEASAIQRLRQVLRKSQPPHSPADRQLQQRSAHENHSGVLCPSFLCRRFVSLRFPIQPMVWASLSGQTGFRAQRNVGFVITSRRFIEADRWRTTASGPFGNTEIDFDSLRRQYY